MDDHTANLVYVTLGVGGLVVSMLGGLIVLVWNVSKGLAQRDTQLNDALEQIAELKQGQGQHEETCVEFRGGVDHRFNRGQRRFDRIEFGLILIMERMGLSKDSLPALPSEPID